MTEKKHPRSALILYGSETGNAQDVAEELGSMAERLHFVTQLSEMDKVQAESLASHTFTVFVVSTTGQGDLPGNARAFWRRLLLKRLPATFLEGFDFAVFGLGDSSYPKFNWAARKLHKRLLQLGANEIYPIGEADQRHPEGLEGTSIPWITDFRRNLLDRYPLPPGQNPIPDDVQLPPKWVLRTNGESATIYAVSAEPVVVPGVDVSGHQQQQQVQVPDEFPRVNHDVRPLPDTFTATLVQNKRVTPPGHWQDVRHICLTVPEQLSYSPGDIICITPKNFAEDVQMLIDLMGWNEQADKLVSLVPGGPTTTENLIPNLESYPRLTLRALLTDYLDIRAIPRRSFFSAIAHCTDDMMHKERLLEFTNPEYIDEFWDYTSRPRRSILEVLHEFHSVKIPWQHAPSVFPVMRARQFSIASGGDLKRTPTGETSFELLIAIVKYQTVIKRIRQGICTRYLSSLGKGSTLRIQLQRGSLLTSISSTKNNDIPHLLLTTPITLIGPGTGIAPLRSLLWEKASLIKTYRQNNNNPEIVKQIPPTILLFGARNRSADFFFETEYALLAPLINLQVLTAFSRDQRLKVYVQDRIRERFGLFFRLLYGLGGCVFLCGSSGRMPQAVREALIECFEYGGGAGVEGAGGEGKGLSRQEAEEYLIAMEKGGRYKQETW